MCFARSLRWFLLLIVIITTSSCYGSSKRNRRKITAGSAATNSDLDIWCCAGGLECCHGNIMHKTTEALSCIPSNDECKYDAEDKKEGRLAFCDEILEINDRFLNDVQPRIMYYAKADCTRSAIAALPVKHDKETYKSVEQLANLTISWYKSFVNIHVENLKKPIEKRYSCCGVEKTLKKSDTVKKTTNYIPPSSPVNCLHELGKGFADYITIRTYVENFLYRTGRLTLKRCPRGQCVAKEVIECGKKILYKLTLTESPTPENVIIPSSIPSVGYQKIQ